MEKQLSFELEILSSGKLKNPSSLKKHLSSKKEQSSKQENQKKQAVKALLPTIPKEPKLDLDFLSSKDNVQREQTSEIKTLKTPLKEQSPKKELLIDNQIHLISVKTVAEMLGLAPKTIHNWVYLRKIPFVKYGQKVMFRPKSLKAWLNRKEKEAKSWL